MRTPAMLSVLAVFVVGVAGCGGGTRDGALPNVSSVSSPRANGELGAIRLTIPKKSSASSARRALFVSPSTTQVTINIQRAGVSVTGYPQTVALTPTSPDCASTLAGLLCTVPVNLAPGAYTATLTVLDTAGTALSAATAVPFTFVAGTNNLINFTLNGIPHAIVASAGSLAIHGSQTSGFTLYGTTAQPVALNAVDADGNYIIGPGSPSFNASFIGNAGFALAQPVAMAPNVIDVTPPAANGNGKGAAISVGAAFSDATCSQPGAVCNASFTIKNDIQTLFVANNVGNTVTGYASPYTGAPTTISNGVSQASALALDAANDLFVADYSGGAGTSVTIYQAPLYAGIPLTVTTGTAPDAVALDATGDLFVANCISSTVQKFVIPYTGPATTINSGISHPRQMLIDPTTQDLFVSNSNVGINQVEVFSPPYTGVPTVISSGLFPYGMVLDAAGDLFIENRTSDNVTEYAPPYTGAPIATITAGLTDPFAMAIDPAGDLFVSDISHAKVFIYPPPYTTTTPVAVSSGAGSPFAIQIDGAGNLIVGNLAGDVEVFAPPYTGTPTTVSSGIDDPVSFTLTP